MNYEDKYNKTIEAIKRIYDQADSFGKELMEKEFPELKESKDERIRKAIFKSLSKKDARDVLLANGIQVSDALSWLEKQGEQKPCMIQWEGNNLKEIVEFTGKSPKFDGWFKSWDEYENYVHNHNDIFKLFNEDGSHYEVPVGAWIVKTPDGYNIASKAIFKQKPADEVKPKFKVGDWVRVISSGNIFKILSVNDGLYRVLCYDGVEANYPIEDVDYDLVYWTIQDAKDGDVLNTSSTASHEIFLFKGLDENGNIKCFCSYDSEDGFCEGKYHFIGKPTFNTHPATKEQRDLLFQKMKEIGYKWDAEKKELIKIEQNPAWSEEDEKMFNSIIEVLEVTPSARFIPIKREIMIPWLKSLKDRVQPQSKQEWNKEDERIRQCLIRDQEKALDDVRNDKYGHSEIISDLKEIYRERIDWLKSLKPNHWKPSEFQLECLNKVIPHNNTEKDCELEDVLTELYNDLKNL